MKKKIIMLGFVISALAYANKKEINLGESVVTSTTGFETQ